VIIAIATRFFVLGCFIVMVVLAGMIGRTRMAAHEMGDCVAVLYVISSEAIESVGVDIPRAKSKR